MATRRERAQRVAVEAGARGLWTAETAQAFVDRAEGMSESEMTQWEQTMDTVSESMACPTCGEARVDWLAVDEGDSEHITCMSCGVGYYLDA